MPFEDNTIELFMWGFQRHFQTSVQYHANRIFKHLDPEYEVHVTILGLIREGAEGSHPVCLEPDDEGWKPSDFACVREKAKHFLALDGEENLMSTTAVGMAAITRRRQYRADHAAVLSALCDWKRKSYTDYYFSGFTPVGDYDIGIILSVTHPSGTHHYKLPKLHAEYLYAPAASLTECVADAFLNKCLQSLFVPSPELVNTFTCNDNELLYSAGKRLMDAPVFAAHSIEGLSGLFDACNFIASLNYEGIASSGGMIIAKENHPNVSLVISLADPIPLSQHRAIRKLLEISSAGKSLVTDGSKLIGFGKKVGIYDEACADFFQIKFVGHHKWEASHVDHKLMKVEYGTPRLPIPPLVKSRFFASFEILFGKNNTKGRDVSYQLSLEACQQRHGTTLVITPAAQEEVIRLSTQVTSVVPFKMNSEILKSVTAIDGAVLLDTDATCRAIGVILDGMAIPNGNPSRGARYNSALRYVDALAQRGIACLIVVVSEDGTSELVPDLPRRISKSLLEEKEKALDDILSLEEWSLDKSFPLVKWFDSNRFYLSIEQCKKANLLLQRHDSALQNTRAIKVTRQEFIPNEVMSELFYE